MKHCSLCGESFHNGTDVHQCYRSGCPMTHPSSDSEALRLLREVLTEDFLRKAVGTAEAAGYGESMERWGVGHHCGTNYRVLRDILIDALLAQADKDIDALPSPTAKQDRTFLEFIPDNVAGQVQCVESADGSGERIRKAPSVLPRAPEPASAAPSAPACPDPRGHLVKAPGKRCYFCGIVPFAAPAEAPTPETDAELEHTERLGLDALGKVVYRAQHLVDKCRCLERQRDAALSRERQEFDRATQNYMRACRAEERERLANMRADQEQEAREAERQLAEANRILLEAAQRELADQTEAADASAKLVDDLQRQLTAQSATLPLVPHDQLKDGAYYWWKGGPNYPVQPVHVHPGERLKIIGTHFNAWDCPLFGDFFGPIEPPQGPFSEAPVASSSAGEGKDG